MILPVDNNGAEATIKTKITQFFMALKPANDGGQCYTSFSIRSQSVTTAVSSIPASLQTVKNFDSGKM